MRISKLASMENNKAQTLFEFDAEQLKARQLLWLRSTSYFIKLSIAVYRMQTMFIKE